MKKSKIKNIFYDKDLNSRHRKSKIFKYMALLSLAWSVIFLIIFLSDMIIKGSGAITQTYIQIEVAYNSDSKENTRLAIESKYRKLVSRSWIRTIGQEMEQNPDLMDKNITKWVLADSQVDMYMKGYYNKLKSRDLKTLEILIEEDRVDKKFNTIFFTNSDSKLPENSGIFGAMLGTIFTLLVTMIVAFPLGVATAVYLEEFSNQNSKISQLIEININNLAAIPSILFGLLGLSVFISIFGLPRSSPLVGGLTLALMTLPIIVVTTRASLRSVPDNIRQAGFALGLTKVQVVKDHVMPLAFSGIMTGSIIGLAQAIGETAPLIIVGMIAFVPDAPSTILDASTVLPAQIFTWAGMPQRAYIERTAAGVLMLLSILITLNATAIILRKKFEIKW
jgi:phosphate transport system permease protein